MTQIAIWLAAALGIVAVVILAALIFSPSKEKEPAVKTDEGISVNASEGSIVTVRKVGRVTSVTIRTQAHDHWEGADGIQVGQIPTEVTRLYRPELYEEYMSAQTSAIRKYEIADELYAEGFTLPYIRGLHEQYKREVAEALKEGGDARTIAERTPVNLTQKGKDADSVKELDINHDQSVEDLDGAPDAESEL